MESLLVHSDCECAVVLVIYADHSSLANREVRERERERAREGQSDRETRHTPLSISILMPSRCSYSPLIALFCTLSLAVSYTRTHTHTYTWVQPFGKWKRKLWGGKRWRKAVKGGKKQTLGTNRRKRTAEKRPAGWLAGALAPGNRNRVCASNSSKNNTYQA